MIDLRQLRETRTDYVVLGAIGVAFVAGGISVEAESWGFLSVVIMLGLAAGLIWYLDDIARVPELDHAPAAEALRDAADELDELDELRAEALAEGLVDEDDAAEDDAAEDEVEGLADLVDRTGVDVEDDSAGDEPREGDRVHEDHVEVGDGLASIVEAHDGDGVEDRSRGLFEDDASGSGGSA